MKGGRGVKSAELCKCLAFSLSHQECHKLTIIEFCSHGGMRGGLSYVPNFGSIQLEQFKGLCICLFVCCVCASFILRPAGVRQSEKW